MTSASVDAKAHHGAHAASSDDFLSSVKALREAEKGASAKVEESKRQAAAIEAQGREKAVEISAKATEKAVAAKNELLSSGREKSDSEVNGILSDAGRQAAKMRAKRLADKDLQEISAQVL